MRLLALYAEACEKVDRAPDWVLRRYIRLGDRKQIEADWLPGFVDRNLSYWRHSTEGPNERRMFERIDAGETLDPIEVARDRFLWGSPDEVIPEIAEYARLGAAVMGVSFSGGMTTARWEHRSTTDYGDFLDAIELFGREIIPAFPD